MGPHRHHRLATLARSIAAARGIELPTGLALLRGTVPTSVSSTDERDPGALGRLLESMQESAERRRKGAWYTPPELAATVAAWALDDCAVPLPTVADPACGGGAFLLAAADVLAGRGHDPADIVRRLVAIDIDPLAVAVTEVALCLWAAGRAVPVTAVGDALLDPWPIERVDVVVGNPPFLNQLSSATARTATRAADLRRALGPSASGYVDESAAFLLAAASRADVVALVQPASLLATSSAAAARAELAPRLRRVWVPGERLFEAEVRVCVVVLGTDASTTWDAVTDDRAPAVDLGDGTRLGEVGTVSAGFRDEYYGLVPLVREREGHPLVTSGAIDPNRCLWGDRPTRFAKQRWQAPAVDRDGLAGSPLAAWSRSQLVPKVLVATQTRVVEAVADHEGAWLPCTPVLSVVAPRDRLWHVLAALLAPPTSAWALRTSAGSALSKDALKLSAAQLRSLPLPPPGPAWDRGAAALADDDLPAMGEAMGDAYGVHVGEWWSARLPSAR